MGYCFPSCRPARQRLALLLLVLGMGLGMPRAARAFDTFGHRGQGVLSLRGDFAASSATVSFQGSQSFVRTFDLRPSLHYFVHDLVFVAADIIYRYDDNDTLRNWVGLGPGFGLNIVLSESVSFGPKVAFPFEMAFGRSSGRAYTLKQLLGILYLPVLFHVTPHFSVGLGPSFTQTLWARLNNIPTISQNIIGLTGSIYGWL